MEHMAETESTKPIVACIEEIQYFLTWLDILTFRA
jgi:hypothetical protein